MLKKLPDAIKKSKLVLLGWWLFGKKIPPPHIYKQQVIKNHQKKYLLKTFIETGTYLGDMVYGVRKNFKNIYTIELSDYYYKLAKNRLSSYKNIKIFKGDSTHKLKQILKSINHPCLFWLDGHYSGGKTAKGKLNTPITKELKTILSHKVKNHIILIDDARHFTGKNDYPSIKWLKNMLIKTNYKLAVKNDIIQITFF